MYFSVKQSVKIAGKAYIPCVCYPLPEALKLTVEHLKKEDKAEIYPDRVYFCNGKIVEKSEVKEDKPKGRKAKEAPAKENTETAEEKTEELPSAEDEGF